MPALQLTATAEEQLLKSLGANGLTTPAAVVLIEDSVLAKEFIAAGMEKIAGRHRLLK